MRYVKLGGLVVLLASCSGKGVTDSTTPPVVPDTTTNPGGTVQRTSLTVRVQIDPADTSLASTAEITASGLTVRLARAGVNEAPRTATTDATGTVRFDALLDGQYTASVERTLSSTELARLAPSDREASVFAGGTTTAVSPPNAPTITLSLAAARRGSLVISEVFAYFGFPIPYNYGYYFEVYNNGDTTEYLDGMLLGRTHWSVLHTAHRAPCGTPEYVQRRTDSTRVWVYDGLRFPGSGTQYPVPPGSARVVATDALNHQLASGSTNFPDLSAAHFESVGTEADTDNPVAANMQIAFNTSAAGTGGRGLRVQGPGALVLIRAPAATRLAQTVLQPVNSQVGAGVPFTPATLWGVPREDVIDVFSMDYSPDYKAYLATTSFQYTMCQPFLASAFERAPAEISDGTFRPGAIRRRTLGFTADGRQILMRTGTSARDLEVSTRLLERSLRRGQ